MNKRGGIGDNGSAWLGWTGDVPELAEWARSGRREHVCTLKEKAHWSI